MGKKKKKLMATFKVKFIDGAVKKGLNKKIAVEIFDLLEKFAEYGFNKSHSTAYSVISYQTAWLKTHYPAEFIASNMSSVLNREDQISMFINDAKRRSIKVIPPSINQSKPLFYANKKGSIIYGLSAIKNVGTKSAQILYDHRINNGEYKTLFDLCEIDSKAVNKKVLEGLIFSGSCDSLDGNRAEKLKSIEVALKYNQKMSKEANSSQSSLFSGDDSLLDTQPKLIQSEELKNSELLQFEKDAFGFYLLQSPLDKHREDLIELSNTGIEKNNKKFKEIRLGGIISAVKILYDKRNNQWAIISLDCIHGSAEIFAFHKTYEKYSNLLVEDNKIFIQGKPSNRDEEAEKPKVIADNIYSLKAIRGNLARSINIKIPYTYQDPKILDKIKEVAKSYTGKLPIILFLENSDQTFNKVRFAEIRLSPESDCLKEIRRRLDKATVKVGI